jgi:predicted nuclease of restriction endonuclease-like (RecB) superfamily
MDRTTDPSSRLERPPNYDAFLADIKERVRSARLRAVGAANRELLRGYWEIGDEILRRQREEGWGAKVIDRLAKDLKVAFPDVKGFSRTSLHYMRQFALEWPEGIVQGGLDKISWYHHMALLDKLSSGELRRWYVEMVVEYGWSRDVMVSQIEGRLHERQGRALTNFARTLPPAKSDVAQQLSKSPYLFEWLGLGPQTSEAELERGLIAQVERFLLEMGQGFALVARQHHVEVGGQDFYLDLLLYQLQLRCYVVIELKLGEFKPEYVGKLGFYLAAVDELVRDAQDNPTIGLILCKSANETVVEYTLRDTASPIQISEYRARPLPEGLRKQLPSTERIAAELNGLGVHAAHGEQEMGGSR